MANKFKILSLHLALLSLVIAGPLPPLEASAKEDVGQKLITLIE